MNPDFQEIRKRIERRFRRRLLFVLHFLVFMAVVLGTAVWISTHYVYAGDREMLWYLMGWGAILFVHWLFYSLANRRDHEIETTWERLYGRAALDDEPQQKFKATSSRLRLFENDEIQDKWVEEKPKRTLHEK